MKGEHMKLITTCLKHKEEERNSEFKYCFIKNLNNDLIDEIVVFSENYDEVLLSLDKFNYLRNDKIRIIRVDSLPSYTVLFDYANDNFKGEIVIIVNADIYYDETFVRIKEVEFKKDMILFLTRWVTDETGLHLEDPCSFDSYIFRSPIRRFYENEKYESIRMAVMGCDTYLLQRAKEAGMIVYNPAFSIKSYHHHKNIHHEGFRYWYDHPHFKVCGQGYCRIEDIK